MVNCTSDDTGDDPEASAAVLKRGVIAVRGDEVELGEDTKSGDFAMNPSANIHDWRLRATQNSDRSGK
jgi:hypothetical protein